MKSKTASKEVRTMFSAEVLDLSGLLLPDIDAGNCICVNGG